MSVYVSTAVLSAAVSCRHNDGVTPNGTWNGNTCEGALRPITYVISNDGEANRAMMTLVQAVVDDAWRGDTIKFTAGQTFNISVNGSAGVMISPRPGDSGYLTITTTMDDKLPPEGTRITPAYADVMPTFVITQSSAVFTLPGAAMGTEHIKFRGLYFRPSPTMPTTTPLYYGFIRIGGEARYSPQLGYFVPSDSNMWATTTTARVPADATTIPVRDSSHVKPGMRVWFGGARLPQAGTMVLSTAPGSITIADPNPVTLPAGAGVYVAITTPEQQPNDIVVQHCVFRNPQHKWQIYRFMIIGARELIVRDNYFSAPLAYVADTQVMAASGGPGPHVIENNYIDGGTENIMYGGSYTSLGDAGVVNGSLIRYNFFPHIPERDQVGTWEQTQEDYVPKLPAGISYPGLPPFSPRLVFSGRVLATGANAVSRFVTALNTGVVGKTKPDFARLMSVGDVIYDGDPDRASFGSTVCGDVTYPGDGVCWRLLPGTSRPLIKNNFELKQGKNITLQHNVFDWYGPMCCAPPADYNTNQAYIILIKASSQVFGGASPNPCAAGEKFPTCHRPSITGIKILNNLIRNTYGGIGMAGCSAYGCTAAGDYTVSNNLVLMRDPGSQPSREELRFFSLGESTTDLNTGRPVRLDGVRITNNTFFADWVHSGASFYAGGADGPGGPAGGFGGERIMAGNIWVRGARGSLGRYNSFRYDGHEVATRWPGTNTGGIWGKNIILGAPTGSFPPDTVWSGCPTPDACITDPSQKPDWSSVFVDPAAGNFSLREDHWGKRAMPDGSDIGADTTQLPEIRNLRVTASDRMVVFEWSVTAPIAHIPCVVELHSAPDFESGSYVAELSDIRTYYGQDSDTADRNARRNERDRMIALGHSIPLAPSTPYYYRLHCGGDVRRGMFVTKDAMSGTATYTVSHVLQHPSATMLQVEYGTEYSRSTDTLINGASGVGTCNPGEPCVVSLEVPKGPVLYYRWREFDGSGTAVGDTGVWTFVAD